MAGAARCLLPAAVGFACAASAQEGADGLFRERIGDYTVIYSATLSASLPERTAERHDVPANAEAVILNVTVEQDGMNIPAMVDARVANLADQTRAVAMRETEANEYTSYVGVIEIAERELLEFDLEIVPEGEDEPLTLEFRQSFIPQTRDRERRP